MPNKKNNAVVDRGSKKNINLKVMAQKVLSVLAFILLAGLAYEGVRSFVDAKPEVQTGFAALFVLMLMYFASKK